MEIRNKSGIQMFKILKHGKDMALRIVFVMKIFWSFGFVSFGIVLNRLSERIPRCLQRG